jgi:hypothetical protein
MTTGGDDYSTFTHQAEADKVRANNNSCWDIVNTETLSLRINLNRAQKNLCAARTSTIISIMSEKTNFIAGC